MAVPKKIYEELLSKSANVPLSDLLPQLLNLSHILKNKDLEKWTLLEFNGYYNTNPALSTEVVVPEYRTVTGQHSDEYGRPLVLTDPKHLFVNEDRVRFAISELENLLNRGGMVSVRNLGFSQIISQHFNVEVSIFSFNSVQIAGVISGIRSKFIEWLHVIESDVDREIKNDTQKDSLEPSPPRMKWLPLYMAIVALVGAIAAVLVVPEFRKLLGLQTRTERNNVQVTKIESSPGSMVIQGDNNVIHQQPNINRVSKKISEAYEPVFDKDNIVPKAFAGAKSGRSLSLIRVAFPSPPGFTSRSHGQIYYEFPVSEGPFKRILFYFDDKGSDPTIERVSFIFRDKQAADHVKNSAFAALDWKCAHTTEAGAIVWSGGCYGGYDAILDGFSFTIR